MRRASWKQMGACAMVLALWPAPAAHAQGAPSEGKPVVMQASEAWEALDLTKAAQLYEQALKEGGLGPADVLVAYLRIGTVKAATNQRTAALSYFRVAATLDPAFELPSEAGPVARRVYQQAREQAKRQGGKLEISAEVPTKSAPGAEFVVVARVPEAFVPLIVDVGVVVSDPSIPTMKAHEEKKPAEAELTFEVPGKVVLAGAYLLVRVDALDASGNRWASTQARVQVDQPKKVAAVPAYIDEGSEDKKTKSSDGFWQSPWPWVIGGAVVLGGFTTYMVTRPTDEVTVAAPTWR